MQELKYWLESNIIESELALVHLRHHAETVSDGDFGSPTVGEEESFKSALEFVLRHLKKVSEKMPRNCVTCDQYGDCFGC
jgi:hypothetical protein